MTKTETITLKNPEGEQEICLTEKNMTYDIFLEDLTPGSRRFKLKVVLSAENATCWVHGRVSAQGQDQKHWQIQHFFEGKGQRGGIFVRGVAEGTSFLEIDANATLKNASAGASAEISEKIILFDTARAKAIPILRVETDDVAAASHAASIAPIDPDQILYLQSRGINKATAQKILREGFLKK